MRRPSESALQELIDGPACAQKKLGDALKYAVNRCDLRLLEWLAALTGPTAETLDRLALQFRDRDGYPLVSTCIIASTASISAKEEKEQAVRIVVKRWPATGLGGGDVVPDGEREVSIAAEKQASWTPLHLAALLSSPTLVSFLLTQGYSPYVTTHKGLRPLDLIADMESRRDVAALLESMMDDGDSRDTPSTDPRSQTQEQEPTTPQIPIARLELLAFHRAMKSRRTALRNRRIKRREEEQAKDAWIVDRLQSAGLGEGSEFVCFAYEGRRRRRARAGRGLGDARDDLASEDSEETDEDVSGSEIDLEALNPRTDHTCRIDESTFLVFSLDTLPRKLAHLITAYPPQAYPLPRRTMPANTVYLWARYAAYLAGDEVSAKANLAGLLEMVMLDVERVCMANVESLPHLAFWLYNVTILLHLLQSDETVRALCEEEELCLMVEEMINALQVHIIRLVEHKLDTLIDPALLDYEPLDEPPVKFDDEWASSSFFRNLTAAGKNSKRRTPAPHVASVFESGGSGGSPRKGAVDTADTGNMGSPVKGLESPSKAKARTLGRPGSIMDLRTSVADSLRAALFDTVSPSNITAVLSSTLTVLQIYSVNPAFIIQIFSQVFVWMAAETFNRIMGSISGKRYQCRSKAMQIRLNLEAVAEWVRIQAALPGDIYGKQFQRVTQLLQWLQCSSQITEFDIMFSAIQHLPDVTPLQLQRAIKDYRHEVGEGRISEECLDYLGQMQREWERRRVKTSIDKIQRQVEARRSYRRRTSGSDRDSSVQEDDDMPVPDINTIFDTTFGLAEYTLPLPPQSASEFEDSKYMLLLSLPQNPLLPAYTSGPIYGSEPGTPQEMTGLSGRPISMTGLSPHQPLQYDIRGHNKLRRLPDDFLDCLRVAAAQEHKVSGGFHPTAFENNNAIGQQNSAHSVVIGVTTPDKRFPSDLSVHRSTGKTQRSPVSPVFAHHALRMKADARQPHSADRPIRLRQLSSGSSGSVTQELSNLNIDSESLPLCVPQHRIGTTAAPTIPESPSRNRGSLGSGGLGSLTKSLWSTRARQASNVSTDGYIDSSDEDGDNHS